MQMKTLIEFIDNSKCSLTDYLTENQELLCDKMINEGLFSWLKKFWKWLFSDTKKNISSNNGFYNISDKTKKIISSDKGETKMFSFGQMKRSGKDGFDELVKLETNKDLSNFSVAKEFHENNQNTKIFPIKMLDDCIGFIFCTDEKKTLKVVKIILAQDILIANKNITKQKTINNMVIGFQNYVKKNYSDYKLDKIEASCVDLTIVKKSEDKTEKNDKPTDKPENEPTDKPENKPTDKPEDKPEDKPTDKPTDKPEDKPTDKPKDDKKDEKFYLYYNRVKRLVNKRGRLERFLKILGNGIFKEWKDNTEKLDYSKTPLTCEYIEKYDLDKLIDKLESFKPKTDCKKLKENKNFKKEGYNHPIIIVKTKDTDNFIGLAITQQEVTKGIKDKLSNRLYFTQFIWNTRYINTVKDKIDNIEFASLLLYELWKCVNDNEKLLVENYQISLTNYILENLIK